VPSTGRAAGVDKVMMVRPAILIRLNSPWKQWGRAMLSFQICSGPGCSGDECYKIKEQNGGREHRV